MDGNLVHTENTTDTQVDYLYTGLTEGNHTYKVITTNGSGLTCETETTVLTEELKTPTYAFDTEWSTSKNITINYHNSDGVYLFKVTGTVTSSLDATDCGTSSVDGQYSCTSTVVPAGTT